MNKKTGNADSVKIIDELPKQLEYVSYSSNLDLGFSVHGKQLEWYPKDKNEALGAGSAWYEIILNLKATSPIDKVCNQATLTAGNANKVISSMESGCMTIKSQTCPGTGSPIPSGGLEVCKTSCPDGSTIAYGEACSIPQIYCTDLSVVNVNQTTLRSIIVTTKKQPGSNIDYVSFLVEGKEISKSAYSFELNKFRAEYDFKDSGNYSVQAKITSKQGLVQESHQCNVVEKVIKSETKEVILVKDSKVSNITQSITDANNTTASPGDILKYTLSLSNYGSVSAQNIEFKGEYSENISDVLEYADLVDYKDGNFDPTNSILSWPVVTIEPGKTVSKEFIVKIKDSLPSTPVSASNPLSYDYSTHNDYGRTTVVKLPKSSIKIIEQVTTSLPHTQPVIAIFIVAILAFIACYFYFRNRLLIKELAIINKEYSNGI